MLDDKKLIVYFHRNDGYRERVALKECTLVEAASGIEGVFCISEGLYTKADIYRGDELVETVENTTCLHVEPILVQ